MIVSLESTVRQKENLLASNLDAETVIMDLDSEHYFGMNRVSSRIWELLSEARRVDSVCEELTAQFAVEPERCRKEVVTFVQKLADAGLVQTVEA